MIKKLGLQLYTVRDHLHGDEAIEKTFEKLMSMGYTEGQTAGGETEQMAEIAKKTGFSIVGTHFDYGRMINDVAGTIKLHEALGTKNIGIGGLSREARDNYDELMRFIEQYNKLAAIYSKEGFKLTYHNHSFEFIQPRADSTKTVMDYLYENFDKDNITFVLDTCWVSNAGGDVCGWLEKLEGRIDILHLKDLRSSFCDGSNWAIKNDLCEIGQGNIFWERVLNTAEKVGVKYYVVEQDGNWRDGDPFKSLQISRDYLDKFMVK